MKRLHCTVMALIILSLMMGSSPFIPVAKAQTPQTVLDQADWMRFMYWLINGPPGGSYPTGFDGPTGGFLGMIRELTGPTALGGGLTESGYTECTDIPATGSASLVEDNGTFVMTFSTPRKTIPAGWPNAGDIYEKRVTVTFNGTTFMDIEFNCSSTAGWMRFFEPEEPSASARHIETYYDTTDSDNTRLELYMYYHPAAGTLTDEYFAAKFVTEAGSLYKIWITRAADESGWSGFRTAIYGNTALAGPGAGGVASAFIFQEQGTVNDVSAAVISDTDDVTGGDIDCIDFNGGSTAIDATTTCTTNSLTLSEAGAPIIAPSGNFSIDWVADSLQGSMTVLP